MADDFTVDFSEVTQLAGSFKAAAAAVMPELRRVVSESARNIQKDTRAQLADHPTWPGIAETVNYDMAGSNATLAQAVVGFEEREETGPAWIHEFGSVDRSPHPTLFPAAQREIPNFEEALGDVAAKVTEGLL